MGTEAAGAGHGILGKPCDSMDPDALYEELIRRIQRYHPSDDTSLIRRAYLTAKNAHMDQRRKSGEPYVIHPVCVAIILADLELDKETIIAGLLHDVVEDTILNKEQLARVFGQDVAQLVDGVTKLTQVNWTTDKLDIQAENLRKMFLAMAKDIRVILIKLADRLHNMRTLQYMKPEKQKEKAKETLEIYGPIADRLGISKIKVELDDLALRYLEPEIYQDLVRKVAERSETSVAFIDGIVDEVQGIIDAADIRGTVNGRQKHYFSIYKKMVNQGKTFDQIYDLFAVRILVESVKDCYASLGVIHEHFKPVPGRFKDYIAMPKQNMYQSLHTTLIYHNGQPFEIQIRTYEMHRTAEYGIAAHWKYKESGNSANAAGAEDEKMNWLRQILEWQRDSADNKEFLGDVKNELSLFSDSVYAFTPTGDVKTLPMGSTPVDFAYAIHSAVGNRMVGARVNGKLVNIDYQIQSGDRIEVITSQNTRGPSRDWLKIVKSSQAKNKINQWFKSQLKEENIVRGKELILNYCKSKGLDWSTLNKPEYQEKEQSGDQFRKALPRGRSPEIRQRHRRQGYSRSGGPFLHVLRTGAGRRHRRLRNERQRNLDPPDRLLQYHLSPGERARAPDPCGVADLRGGRKCEIPLGDPDHRTQPSRPLRRYFEGLYGAEHRYPFDQHQDQPAGNRDRRPFL